MATSREDRLLLGWLDEGFDAQAWHGTPLRGAVRGVTAARAGRRPGRGRHNIWEIVVHCAYWKYAVRRRLAGLKRGTFAYAGSNWFARPARRGRAAMRLLLEEHRQLRGVVRRLPPGRLAARGRGSALALVRGIAAHDLYHAGQIQLLKRLVR